jgi:hypothetical protein
METLGVTWVVDVVVLVLALDVVVVVLAPLDPSSAK